MNHSKKWYRTRLQKYFDTFFKEYEETAEWYVDPAPNKWNFTIPELGYTFTLYCNEQGEVIETKYESS